MPRKKGKKSKQNVGSRRRQGRTRGKATQIGTEKRLTFEYACSLKDPFSCAASLPDGAPNVRPFSVKSNFTMASGTSAAGGNCSFFAWSPAEGATSFLDAGSAASSPTISGASAWTLSPGFTQINGLYARIRPISSGVRATYIGSTVSDQGLILAGQVSGEVPLSSFNGAISGNALTFFSSYRTFPLRSGCEVIWRPEDAEDTDLFVDTTATAISATAKISPPYLVIIVYGGGANQGFLSVEAVNNYEGQYNNQNFIPGGLDTQPLAPEPGWKENAVRALWGVQTIMPYVASAIDYSGGGGLATAAATVMRAMSGANGLAMPGTMSKTGLPRLTF